MLGLAVVDGVTGSGPMPSQKDVAAGSYESNPRWTRWAGVNPKMLPPLSCSRKS